MPEWQQAGSLGDDLTQRLGAAEQLLADVAAAAVDATDFADFQSRVAALTA